MSFPPNVPDWTPHLQEAEQLLWTGRPEREYPLIAMALFVVYSLFFGLGSIVFPLFFFLFFVVLGLLYARDAYALTNRRIFAYRHPFGGRARIEALPRAGTYAGPLTGPLMSNFLWAVVFTAPDRTRITFQFQSRATSRMLIDSYPKGGPFPSEGISL